MKIATWNVNSLKVRLPQVLRWLHEQQPDVLALQELKMEQDAFPEADFQAAGYHAVWNGQKTYNGVALLAKTPIADAAPDIPGFDDVQKRVIAGTVNGVRIVCAYCVNGEAVGSEKFAYKERWFAALGGYLKTVLHTHGKVVLLGDFNIAPADIDVYDAEKWRGKILCSPAERGWFDGLLQLGLHDSLRQLYPDNQMFSWWDYRMNMFKRGLGLRIDHILVSDALAGSLKEGSVDTSARAWERPSDHAPVWLVLDD